MYVWCEENKARDKMKNYLVFFHLVSCYQPAILPARQIRKEDKQGLEGETAL